MNKQTNYPIVNIKIFFLKELNKSNLHDFSEFRLKIYKDNLGDINALIVDFKNSEYIRETSFIECVNKFMVVDQLKKYLKSKGISVQGKKADLIHRAIEFFTDHERAEIQEKGSRFIILPKGWELIDSEAVRFDSELNNFFQAVTNELSFSSHLIACKYVSDFIYGYPFPIGMGSDYQSGFDEKYKSIVAHIMKTNYITDKIKIDVEVNLKIRSLIAAGYLFDFTPFRSFDIPENILLVFPEIRCMYVEEFLKNNDEDFDINTYESKKEMMYYLQRSIINEATNKIEYDLLLNMKNNIKGISILEGNCHLCKGMEEKFYWNDLNNLPKLPKAPNCICSYLPITGYNSFN